MKTNILIFFLFLSIISFSISEKNEIKKPKKEKDSIDYYHLLQWATNNGLNITEKIKLEIDSKKKSKKYIAKNLIPEEELIMDIPYEIMLNIDSALKLLNSKKFTKAYDKFLKYDKNRTRLSGDDNDFHVEQSFLAYLLYLMKRYPKTYTKNPFYKYYKYMYTMFEDNLESTPFYFSSEQIRLFLNTSFGSIFELVNSEITEEINIYENVIFNKTMSFDSYLPYRIFAVSKTFNISNHNTFVPFIDLFRAEFKGVNCEYKIENNHMKIYAKKNIFPGEDLILQPQMVTNTNRLIFTGNTYEEMTYVIPSFNIPCIFPSFIKKYGLENGNSIMFNRVELADAKNFHKNNLYIYKEVAKMIKKDNSDLNAYKIFLENLEDVRKNYDYIKSSDIYEAFYKQKDIDNVKRIIKGEVDLIDKRIKILKEEIKKLEKKSNKKEKEEKVNDL